MKKLIVFIILNFLFINVLAVEDATLKNIKINDKECECSEYVCEMEVTESNVTITYELSDPNATVDRESGVSTPISSNVTNIKVNVTNGESHIAYEFIITKHVKSSDYTLKELYLNDEEINLMENVFVYNKAVDFDEENVSIKAVANDSKATVDSELVFLFPIDESSKALDFKVKAENGEEKNYRVIVTRKSKPDTTLKSLKIDRGVIDFNKDILEYDINVDYVVNDIIIEAIANDENAVVKITKEQLEVGDNVITILVTNENLSSAYTLNVNRSPNLDKSQANLESLEVVEYKNLDFDPNVLEYDLLFKDIPSSLTVNAKSVNEGTKIEILNNENLSNGDVVTIQVTLEESEIVRIYTLKISEKNEINDNKLAIVITLIILVITIIVLLILNIRDSKKRRSKNKSVSKKNVKKEEKKEKAKEIIEEIEII